jgi:hypothetical protein
MWPYLGIQDRAMRFIFELILKDTSRPCDVSCSTKAGNVTLPLAISAPFNMQDSQEILLALFPVRVEFDVELLCLPGALLHN